MQFTVTAQREQFRRIGAECAVLLFFILSAMLSPAACSPEAQSEDRQAMAVTVWAHHGQPDENEAMREIVDSFNDAHRESRGRIQIEFFPDSQYADKVSIAAATGQLPDLIEIDGPYVGPWAAEGLLAPLDDFVTPHLLDDFLDSVLQQGTYDHRLYALGAFDSALVVYFNRRMIAQAGLCPPDSIENAWTWDEFTDALDQVKPHASIPLSLHMDERSDEWITYAFAPLIWSAGGRLIDIRQQKVAGVLDAQVATQALRRWQQLFTDGLAEPTATNPNPFSAGLAAFDWTGHWMLPVFEATDDLEFGVMPLPRMGDTSVAPSGSWCWGISRDCEDSEAAWKVLNWLIDPEHGIAPIVRANGAVPARRSAFDLFPEYRRMPYRLFREQLESAARPRPRTSVYLTLTGQFARALHDIALGADVESRLSHAAANIQKVLDRHVARNVARGSRR